VIIETMNDAHETKAALLAAKENCDLPVIVSNVYDESGKLMTGADPLAMVALIEGLSADAIGMNCAFGPDKMLPILSEMAKHTSLPIIVQPNAGLPFIKEGKTCFPLGAEDFAKEMVKLSEAGATLLGGCCGTTPDYIRALIAATKDLPIKKTEKKNETVISSYTHGVIIDKEPILIGERINPTGKKRVKEALQSQNLSYILEEAAAQVEDGAHILDVNVGVPGLCEKELLPLVAEAVQEISDAPLQLDSSDPAALAAALRRYNGKALINSVSGKRESMDKVFPLVKKYGGVLVALTMDDEGIPTTAEARVAVAKRILAEGKKYGLSKKDFLFDPLCMTVSADKNSARITLKAVEMLTKLGMKTVLGVSNVSFGLPERERINAAFYTKALERGLSAAILNPHSAAMKNAYVTHRLLGGLDEGAQDYIAFVSESEPKTAVTSTAAALTLTAAIEKGMKDEAERLAKEALLSEAPEAVINNRIIPALTAVGERFEKKTLFLPGLLMSAEAATRAFAAVKDAMPKKEAANTPPILLATVKGDIHDIGKNIVKVLLESHGYPVLDLGRDVAPESVLSAAKESGAMLVGLSALMTTTVPAMEDTIALLKKELPAVRIMVGGAVVTSDFAKRIGADFYAADGMGAVHVVKEFFKD
jgi:5-methyltetrahydrofolate--homocysteine methyltransferase